MNLRIFLALMALILFLCYAWNYQDSRKPGGATYVPDSSYCIGAQVFC